MSAVGRPAAYHLLLTGRRIDAARAWEHGLSLGPPSVPREAGRRRGPAGDRGRGRQSPRPPQHPRGGAACGADPQPSSTRRRSLRSRSRPRMARKASAPSPRSERPCSSRRPRDPGDHPGGRTTGGGAPGARTDTPSEAEPSRSRRAVVVAKTIAPDAERVDRDGGVPLGRAAQPGRGRARRPAAATRARRPGCPDLDLRPDGVRGGLGLRIHLHRLHDPAALCPPDPRRRDAGSAGAVDPVVCARPRRSARSRSPSLTPGPMSRRCAPRRRATVTRG